jgi:predicted kinase
VRVLVTGMSGTGKSAVVRELRRRGYAAHDADDGFSTLHPDGTWHWDTERVRRLLADHADLFFAGCSEEQRELPWDAKVVLTVPDDVLRDRLASRTSNDFGTHPAELARVLADRRDVEPLLLAAADLVLDTRQDLSAVVDAVLALTRPAQRDGGPA